LCINHAFFLTNTQQHQLRQYLINWNALSKCNNELINYGCYSFHRLLNSTAIQNKEEEDDEDEEDFQTVTIKQEPINT
jgi:hypothetical protein